MLRQYDVWKKAVDPNNPTGLYFWSSVYYYDTDDFSTPAACLARVQEVDSFITLDSVEYTHTVVKEPPGRDNVIQTVNRAGNHGGLSDGGEGYSLITIGRLTVFFADGRSSYKLLRSPMPARFIHGIKLTPEGILWMSGFFGAWANIVTGQGGRNKYGARIVGGVLDDIAHMWQQRHGTKRRQRTY